MENIAQLDVRINGKTRRMQVTDEIASVKICLDPAQGLRVRCYPSGNADFEKRDPRSGVFLYEGLGSWHLPTGDKPAETMIRIKRKTKITAIDSGRERILDQTIEVPANPDYEDMGFRFSRDGRIWFVPIEDAEQLN